RRRGGSSKQHFRAARREPAFPHARGARHRPALVFPLGQEAVMSWVQKRWDARAALNFMLGGAGGGLMVAAAMAYPDSRVPVVLSLALVAAGLGAVWLEIGEKLRAGNVLFNPFTSWMTRESFAALLLFALGAAALWRPGFLPFAAAAALAFVYCQGRILRASKGIPAWRAPQVTLLVVATALAEGAGIALFFTTAPLAVGWLR